MRIEQLHVAPRQAREHDCWQDEAEQERQCAGARERESGCTMDRLASCRAGRRPLVAGTAARAALEPDHRGHGPQQQHRELCGRGPVSQAEPGLEDAGGEGLQRKIRHGAIVGERLHDRERDTGRDRGTREREHRTPERDGGRQPRQPRRQVEAGRSLDEGCPYRQIHVRKQHQDEQDDRSGQRADLGKPVFARPPSGELADRGLDRSAELQEVGVRVRDHIGRHGERQHQPPLEPATPRKVQCRHAPCACGAYDRDTHSDRERENQAVEGIARKDGVDQVGPDLRVGTREQREHESGERQSDDHA